MLFIHPALFKYTVHFITRTSLAVEILWSFCAQNNHLRKISIFSLFFPVKRLKLQNFQAPQMTSPTRKFIGGRIRALRKAKGITQAVLAEALECEIATISRYERGDNPPDSEQLLKLAKLLNVSPMDILPSETDIARAQVIELRAKVLELVYKIDSPQNLEKLIRTIHLLEKN